MDRLGQGQRVTIGLPEGRRALGYPETPAATRWRPAPAWLKWLRRFVLPAPEQIASERVAREIAQAFFWSGLEWGAVRENTRRDRADEAVQARPHWTGDLRLQREWDELDGEERFIRIVRTVLIRECLTAFGSGEAENPKPVAGDTSCGNRGRTHS